MVDLITTEVIRSKFQALLSEMRFLLFRSAYSSLMRESRDCSFGVCSADGEVPFQGASSHLHVYRRGAQRLLAKVGIQDLHEGDIYIGNDPHEIGAPHSPDVLVMSPVFFEGSLIAFCGSIAHKMDFGGAVPGSVYSGATEVYQEGLVLPLLKFYDGGEAVGQVEELIRANVRNADIVMGDLGAQIGATLVAVDRVKGLARRYGEETLGAAFGELLAAPGRRIEQMVERWPGREAEAETLLDPPPNHDRAVRLHLRVSREGGHLTFDFSQCDPQVRAPVNIPWSTALYLCCMGLLGMTDPDLPENSGVARAITLVAREGTVVNPVRPAPVGNTTRVMGRFIDLVLNSLASLKEEQAIAERGDAGTTAFGWRAGLVPGRKYVQYEIQNSTGTGATSWCDGVNGVNPHSYAYSRRTMDTIAVQETPVEILEAQFPVRVRRFEMIPDSGGPGKFRGGAARRRLYEGLAAADLNVRHAHSFAIPPQGAAGGGPGGKGRVVVNLGTPSEVELEGWSHDLAQGDTLAFDGPGGGGFGDPFLRDPDLVLRDVVEGFVTPEGAHRDYGVVVRASDGRLALDGEATRRLRSARLRQAPGR